MLSGSASFQPVEAERAEPAPRRGHGGPAPGAGQQQRQRDVFLGGQLGHQLTGLEHEPEPVTAQRAAPVVAERVKPLPGEPDLAGFRHQDAGQAVQQGGLARPARSHDGDDLAPLHRERGVPQGRRRAERLHQAPRRQDGLRRGVAGADGGTGAGGHRRTARAS
jgi:hypothetical protein